MNELVQALIAESYAAPPSHILEGLTDDLVHRKLPNVPHTIYAELWHLAFWQQITLDWIAGVETPTPTSPLTASRKNHTQKHGNNSAAASSSEPRTPPQPPRTPSASTIPSAA